MKKRTKAQAAAAMRASRAKKKAQAVTPVSKARQKTVTPPENTPLVVAVVSEDVTKADVSQAQHEECREICEAPTGPVPPEIDSPASPAPEVVALVPDYFRQCVDQAEEIRLKAAEIARLDDVCTQQAADLVRLRAEVARLDAMQERQLAVSARSPISKQPPVTSNFKPEKPPAAPPVTAAEALRQRVIDEKVNRINTFGKGHVIGSARI